MSDEDTTINLRGLDKLIKALSVRAPKIRVGILGSETYRNDGETHAPTNAEIGAAHEFGTIHTPMRSFLRVPLANNLDSKLEASGAFDKDALDRVIKGGSILPWAQKVAIVAEGVVLDSFANQGDGQWPALKPATMRRKQNKQILVETNQLRDSITSEVTE